MIRTCCFEYADGFCCEEPVRPATFGPISELTKGTCPDTGSDIIRAHFPTTSHEIYCTYHQKMMDGRMIPSNPRLINRSVLSEIYKKVKERELQVILKKNKQPEGFYVPTSIDADY